MTQTRTQAWLLKLLPRSLQWQALVLMLLSIGLTAVIATTFFSRSLLRDFSQELDKRGRSSVKTLAKDAELRLAIALKDTAQGAPILQEFAASDVDVKYVAILGPDKKIVAHAPTKLAVAEVQREADVHFKQQASELLRFTQEVKSASADAADLDFALGEQGPAQGERISGYIVLGVSAESLSRRLFNQTVLIVITSGLLLAFLFILYFRWVTRRVEGMVRFAESLAEGDLQKELEEPYRDELGRLARSLRDMSQKNRALVVQLVQASESLTASAKELIQASSRSSANANQQAATVSEMSAAVDQLRQSFQQSTKEAESVIEKARTSDESSSSGTRAVEDSLREMSGIREQVGAVAVAMQGLVGHAREISAIIEAVGDIAERSKLLAFNAGIEAATAGEHGRGFAVVASEVHSLAEQSKTSTRRIRDALRSIDKGIVDVGHLIEEGSRRADQGMKVSESAGKAIQRLASTIGDSSRSATNIAASIREQSAGVDQIVQATEDIGRIAAETTEGIRLFEQSAGAMNEAATVMAQLVGRYRV